mgnify:CR=1 FL=1
MCIRDRIFTLTSDRTGDQRVNVDDLEWRYLQGDGDFRSEEVKRLRDESDIIITNPPFSMFREFLAWIMEAEKQFVIIGNLNAITYKEVFPLIKNNEIWLGNGFHAGNAYFFTPFADTYGEGVFMPDTGLVKFRNVCWFTNLDHGRRHQPLPLMSMTENLKFSKHKEIRGKTEYIGYDNYDAIEVPFPDAIPSDYDGVMGVPVSFIDKYNPEQFMIVGTSDNGLVDDIYKKTLGLTKNFVDDYYKAGGKGTYKEGNPSAGYYENNVAKMAYKRIFIKHRR